MLFANIDGPNGVGKTTAIEYINTKLTDNGLNVKVVHFHRRDTLIGRTIQKVLNEEEELDMESLQMLYAADMLDFTNKEFKDLRESDYDVLLTDRYNTSSLAIGTSIGIELQKLLDFHKYDAVPDINYILYAEPREILARVKTQENVDGQSGDIFEEENKLIKIIESYRNLKVILNNVIEIDTTKSSIIGAEKIVNDILRRLEGSEEKLSEMSTFRTKRRHIMDSWCILN